MRSSLPKIESLYLTETLLDMPLAELIAQHSATLTPSERRVAEMLLQQPQLVAFGTVADLANAAEAGVATVVRLSSKLGFSGFSALQSALQQSMASQLLPAAVRIKEHSNSSVSQQMQLEIHNIQQTLERLDGAVLEAVIERLSQIKSSVALLSGNASAGVAQQFIEDLSALRPNVQYLSGNPVQVGRSIAQLGANDVLLVLDLRRYDAWLIHAVKMAHEQGVRIIAIADSVLSPLAQYAEFTLIVAAAGAGPFDSHVGTLALFNVINAGVAQRLKSSASQRLERSENAWHGANLLVER